LIGGEAFLMGLIDDEEDDEGDGNSDVRIFDAESDPEVDEVTDVAASATTASSAAATSSTTTAGIAFTAAGAGEGGGGHREDQNDRKEREERAKNSFDVGAHCCVEGMILTGERKIACYAQMGNLYCCYAHNASSFGDRDGLWSDCGEFNRG
jgi:hypothetical protein